MIEMCKLREPYKCICCGEEMLFFVSGHNLIDYKRLFFKYGTSIELKNYLRRYNIRYMKCVCCNKLFIIDWTTGYPIQVTDKDKLTKFMCKG